jgi:hypothetical protein
MVDDVELRKMRSAGAADGADSLVSAMIDSLLIKLPTLNMTVMITAMID